MASQNIPGFRVENHVSIYEQNAEMLYGILKLFLPEQLAAEVLEKIAKELLSIAPESGYQRYAKLLCIRLAYQQILTHPQVKTPQAFSTLSKEHFFCLLLRDQWGLTCSEIGAALNLPEGSVRLRLEKARIKLASTTGDTSPPSASSKIEGHTCIRARHLIEDWSPGLRIEREQYNVPNTVSREVGPCGICEQALQNRLASLDKFHHLNKSELPENLKAFPVSPMLAKEGRKWVLNWASSPWYFKALFEGFLATSLVLGVVFSIPRIKQVYEFWLERRLDLYSIAELTSGSSSSTLEQDAPTPTTVNKPVAPIDTTARSTPATPADQLSVKPETEFIGRDAEKASSDKIYRILIKSDSPESVQADVLQTLKTHGYSAADEENASGEELPGGIMFDVYIPLKNYKSLVNDVVRFGEPKIIITHSKEKNVPGQAHLKIWLQRI